MKRLLALAMVLVFGLMGCAKGGETPTKAPSGPAGRMGAGSVALVITDSDGEVRPFCTGVWVSETEIVTANHCVVGLAKHLLGEDQVEMDPMGIKVHYIVEKEVDQIGTEPSAVHLSHVVALDEQHDLALLKAVASGAPSHEVVGLAGSMPGLGEQVYVVGHPRGLYWSYISGTVSSYREGVPGRDDVGKLVQVSAPVWFGNSGGGVFNSDGELVGIASFLTLRAPNVAFFVHIDYVKNMLKTFHEPAPDLKK